MISYSVMIPRGMSDDKKRPDPQSKPRTTPSASADKDKKDKKAPRTRKAGPKPPVARETKTAPTTGTTPKAQAGPVQESLLILMVASEAHPYAKTGGLAEVAAALPAALGRLGHRVTLVLPRYRGVDIAGARSQSTSIQLGGRALRVAFRTTDEHAGVTAAFVDVPELFDRDGGLYNVNGVDYPDNAWRFAVFCRAALEYARLQGHRPSIIHAHDWQTGLVPVYQKMYFSPDPVVGGVPAICTIHNLAFQGTFPASTLPSIGLGWEMLDMQALEFWKQISYLKGGINFSERLMTVSPTYAREILTPEFGFGLDGALRRRADVLTGILNGIDVERWNPETDPLIGTSYGADDLAGKATAKQVLLETVGLPNDATTRRQPIIGMVSRLTDQKGFDLITAAADELMSLDATWVMLGSGEPQYEGFWRTLAARYPKRVSATLGFDERLAHRIEAGSDMFLMPSRFEPCGLNQMYSLRYGTSPIVRATGGLEDTVRDVSAPGGNGFKFKEYSATALVAVVRRALDFYAKPSEWKKIQQVGMKEDFSWDASAREYVKVYESAAGAARGKG
jgi:starch synthase